VRLEPIPDGLRAFAPAKLNLYLEIGPRRSDGYHDIDSIFQAITLYDELEAHRAADGTLILEEEGIAEAEKNLVMKAARKLLASGLVPLGRVPGARLRLRKRIPEGAGLGGGSSDAAAALVALASLWELDAPASELARIAVELGSDVPFFLHGGTARCRGRGERVESWSDAFDAAEPFHFVLAYPRVKVSTRIAYDALDASRELSFTLTASSPLDSMPPATARNHLGCGKLFYNRFESVVYSAFPEVRSLHASMSRQPFLKVLLSGSGSTVYGVCRTREEARAAAKCLESRVPAELFVAESARDRPLG
jgi:4-diphosphocytidyl-2-C-methyl-D-erythritol kinase